jgi:cytochrome-b5 reductase
MDLTLLIIAALVALAVAAYFMLGAGKVAAAGDEVALQEATYLPFKLTQRTQVSPNTVLFRFSLPSASHRVGLPVGKHMLLRFMDSDGKHVSRPYTPVSSDDDRGYFDLLVKLYPQGKMSQKLLAMQVGDTIEARGPQGSLHYLGGGQFKIARKGGEVQHLGAKQVGMIAGGSGITPMLQVLREVHKHSATDFTKLSLLFANVTEADILLRKELEELRESRSLTAVTYTLDKPDDVWTGARGFVTPELIKTHLPAPHPNTLILLCGPKPMVDMMEKHLLGLGYSENMYFKY